MEGEVLSKKIRNHCIGCKALIHIKSWSRVACSLGFKHTNLYPLKCCPKPRTGPAYLRAKAKFVKDPA